VRLAIAGMALAMLAITFAGAWAEARWSNSAGALITVRSLDATLAADTLWQLRRIDGVGDAVAVFRGELAPEDVEDTGWRTAWFYANQADTASLAFLAPDPALKLHRGRLPELHSPDEAVLSYELAQSLRLGLGDELIIHQRGFRVVGIWGPSARFPGNFVQISLAAAEAITLSSGNSPYYFLVLPERGWDVTELAHRIWDKLPDVDVSAPDWELGRARHERSVLLLALGGAVILAALLSLPVLGDLTADPGISTMPIALLSGVGGLSAGWIVALAVNLYARQTLGLTPLRVSPRLAIAVMSAAAGMGLLAARIGKRWSWPMRRGATALVLILCSMAMVAVGALNESLTLSVNEAQQAAVDWVTLPGARADGSLLRDLDRVPGIRGYTIEAYGGLADEDEERWVGPRPASGVLYGVEYAGGEGTLAVPYRLGYRRGGPLNPAEPREAVIGYDLAQEQGLDVGDSIRLRETPFTVVGVRERLPYDPGSDANHRVDISLEALRRVLHDPFVSGEVTLLIPPARNQEEKLVYLSEMAARLNVGRVVTIQDRMADIASAYPAAWSLRPADAQEIVRHARTVYVAVLVLCSVLLLAISALAVGGAMLDRIRRDEGRVALLRALGSDEGLLLGDYLTMASLLGLAGGIPGVLGGWVLSNVLNGLGPSRSGELLFTPALSARVFFFTVLSAMLAAVVPVSRGIRRDAAWTLYASAPESGALPVKPVDASLAIGRTVTHGGAAS